VDCVRSDVRELEARLSDCDATLRHDLTQEADSPPLRTECRDHSRSLGPLKLSQKGNNLTAAIPWS